jgi:tetratricopeptide (TPR) repeat protein
MGSVYRAYDTELGHEVALKVLHTLAPKDRLLLKVEFRALSNIVHPNLVNLYELIADEQSCFFTMELISGVDFVRYIRGSADGDPASIASFHSRMRDAARQLALALHALHESGKLHRDVKPSNVLVTDAGRVVLLDFGLIAPLTPLSNTPVSEGFVGTIPYVAPEQAWGETLLAPADWYSFGVTLYEAATGKLPIDGPPMEVALRKRDYKPASLIAQGHDIPEEIDRLLFGLLDPAREKRPSGDEILACLGGGVGGVVTGVSIRPGAVDDAGAPMFVGRQSELGILRNALDTVMAGVTRVVHISGTSGIGKSCLVREFLRGVALSDNALILESRCHPQETVAFNAIDGLIDELAQHLAKQRDGPPAAFEPDNSRALLKVFPGLGRAFAPPSEGPGYREIGAQETRRQAFVALRELFGNLIRRRPLILWADDVQWADEDSGVLLRELLRPSTEGAFLLILSYRAEDHHTSPCLRILKDAEVGHPVLPIALGPLDDDDSARLVKQTLGSKWQGDEKDLEELARDSNGSPFFLSELARYLGAHGPSTTANDRMRLDEMLHLRMGELSPESLRVVELLSVAGAPLEQRVTLRAAGFKDSDRGLIASLERQAILRTADAQKRTTEVYHHRIRDAVLGQLSNEVRAEHHRSIAGALLTSASPNPVAAVDHFEAAGDAESVRRYVVVAAHHASHVLAFERAAKLYQRAIDLGATEMEPFELHRRLGLALSNAGRGREAGQAFLEAAKDLRNQTDPDREQILQLEEKAAEQFIQTGHYKQGMNAFQAVLAEVDVPFPRTRGEALRKATVLRLLSLVWGVKLPEASGVPPDPRPLRRFDALWSVLIRLAMVDHTLASWGSQRCMLDAIAMRDPSRMICAFCWEADNTALLPGEVFQRRADHLIDLARKLSAQHSTPYDDAFLKGGTGVIACFRGQFRKTVDLMDQAMATLRAASPGRKWEYSLWQIWAVIGLAYLGEIRELSRRVTETLEDAHQREDRFTALNATLGWPVLTWLAEDRPDYAQLQIDTALTMAPSQYTTQHYLHYFATVDINLYRNDGLAAWERSVKEWPLLKKNHFLMIVLVRDILIQARARAALGAATLLEGRGNDARTAGKHTSKTLRRVVTDAADQLNEHGLGCGRAWASLLRASVSRLEKEDSAAVSHLRQAIEQFDECEMRLYREAARYCLGNLLGSREGMELVQQAERWMNGQGIVNPAATVRMIAPGA